MNDEYHTLKLALTAMRENAMDGDLSGFETDEDLVNAIIATEARLFELQRAAFLAEQAGGSKE